MTFDDSGSFGFSSSTSKVKTKCKTFESSSPPEFKGNTANFIDNKTGARIELEKNRVEGFRRKDNIYRIKVCGR